MQQIASVSDNEEKWQKDFRLIRPDGFGRNTCDAPEVGSSAYGLFTGGLFSYSARRYDLLFAAAKMPRDAFLGEALYEVDKALEKFTAARRGCACSQSGGRSRR